MADALIEPCPECDGAGWIVEVVSECCGHLTPGGNCRGDCAVPKQTQAECPTCAGANVMAAEPLIETLARALSQDGLDGCESVYFAGNIDACVDPPCPCRKAVRTFLAALQAAGMVVVPREPTLEMIGAARECADCYGDIWRAMLAATGGGKT